MSTYSMHVSAWMIPFQLLNYGRHKCWYRHVTLIPTHFIHEFVSVSDVYILNLLLSLTCKKCKNEKHNFFNQNNDKDKITITYKY